MLLLKKKQEYLLISLFFRMSIRIGKDHLEMQWDQEMQH